MIIGKYYITEADKVGDDHQLHSHSSLTSHMWLVVRSLRVAHPKKECVIDESSVFKLGRTVFYTHIDPVKTNSSNSEERANATCRFCYSDSTSEENPLLSVCKCSGTMKFVHFLCLKEWLKYLINVQKGEGYCSYYWKSLECELCKSQYPCIIFYKLTHQKATSKWTEKR